MYFIYSIRSSMAYFEFIRMMGMNIWVLDIAQIRTAIDLTFIGNLKMKP